MRRVDVQLFEINYPWVHLERYEIQINSSCNCPTQEKIESQNDRDKNEKISDCESRMQRKA